MLNLNLYRMMLCLLMMLLVGTKAWAQAISISNPFVKVEFNSTDGIVRLFAEQSGQLFAVSDSFQGLHNGRQITVNDSVFGAGDAIVISNNEKEIARIVLYPSLPFALFQSTLWTEGEKLVNRVEATRFTLKLPQSANALRTLGTGGLLAPDHNPGSYAWIGVADPKNMIGIVAGWLTHDRASGVLFSRIHFNAVKLQSRSDYGRLRIEPGKPVLSEILAIGWFKDTRMGLESWADAVARRYRIKLHTLPTGFCTWYTEKNGGSSDERSIADLAHSTARNLMPYGFQFVQIDDGWQQGDSKGNGPNKNFTTYRTDGPYSAGMKATAETLNSYGLTSGIWFMPFAGTYNDPWFASHKDWFVKHDDGSVYDTPWGGTSLDMTRPDVKTYLYTIAKRFSKDWGYRYFKMDGLYTGLAAHQVYINSGYTEDGFGDAVFFDSEKTNIEAFRDGLKLIRKAAGPDVFFLGCSVTQNMRSYAGSFGLVDAMRIGPDNDGSWKGWLQASPVFGSRHYFLNGRIWYNDPDPNYVRVSLTQEEARTIASWPAITGQLNSNSDWIPDLPADRIEILKRTMPSHHATARPVDLFENDPPRVWNVHDNQTHRDVIAMFNWSDKTIDFNVPLAQVGLDPTINYVGFDFWANRFIPVFSGSFHTSVNSHGCQMIAMRPLLNRPFVLSTSRHVTQGIIDVESEAWSDESSSLSGVSQVVGTDSYELRIVVPRELTQWHLASAAVSADDQQAGVTITTDSPDGLLQRVTVISPTSRSVNWKLNFYV